MLEGLRTPARQAAATNDALHRPWPLPSGPWLMAQTLEDQLFAHWPVAPADVRPLLPRGLEPDEREGAAWVTLTTFHAAATRLRGTLPVPVLSGYRQASVRTYVRHEDRPGILFLRVEVTSPLAAEAGRRLFGVPVGRARIHLEARPPELDVSVSARGDVFAARARTHGRVAHPKPESLDAFLLDRFCFYAERGGRLLRADAHHPPWPVRAAELAVDLNTLVPAAVADPEAPARAHVSERQDFLLWAPVPAHERA